MQRILTLISLAVLVVIGLMAFSSYKGAILGGENNQYPVMTASQDFYSLTANTLEGESFSFEQLKGKRVMIVNTASRCGYTPQYEKLQALFKEHGGEDFVILGFPCNQFGRQEPGSSEEIWGLLHQELRGDLSDDGEGGCQRRQTAPGLSMVMQWG